MTAVDETAQAVPLAIWCAAQHVVDPLVLCRRLVNHPGLHTSDGADDWVDPRVSPPTTSNEETRNG